MIDVKMREEDSLQKLEVETGCRKCRRRPRPESITKTRSSTTSARRIFLLGQDRHRTARCSKEHQLGRHAPPFLFRPGAEYDGHDGNVVCAVIHGPT